MKANHINGTLMLLAVCMLLMACEKGFLDKRPKKNLSVPITLKDFQAILDNSDVMNMAPALNTLASDDYFTTDQGWMGYRSESEQVAYTWSVEPGTEGGFSADWANMYQVVFYSNVVLDGLKDINANVQDSEDYKRIKGSALFFRAYAFYQLAQVFAKPYTAGTAKTDLGIPLHLTSDVNMRPRRGTLQQTYDRIITDLTESAGLLEPQAQQKTRPSKQASYALLARVNLLMGDYAKAFDYASSCLNISDGLIDYNTLDPTDTRPIPSWLNNNPEVIFYAQLIRYGFLTSTQTYVDSVLYAAYKEFDMRKFLFFRDRGNNRFTFKGNYTGSSTFFAGLAMDEVYLIRAECAARLGDRAQAVADMSRLLVNRYREGEFKEGSEFDGKDMVPLVLLERRKELLTRGLRWPDLRRLNKDPNFATTISRGINNISYRLEPGDKRYTFPIPLEEIKGSGIPQN